MAYILAMLKNIDTLVFVGCCLHVLELFTAIIVEDRFDNRIEKLEKELKEMKSNGQRNCKNIMRK